MADSMEVQVARIEVKMEEQEKADLRHEAEMTTLNNKINACFAKFDALENIVNSTAQSVQSIKDWIDGKKNRNWAIISIFVAQGVALLVSLIM